MSKFKLLLKGSALRTAESVVSIICGFVTMPLLFKHLGVDLYGVWVLSGSFVSAMYIFDFGFASAVTRHVTHAIALKDHKKANTIISSAFLLYCILALIIVIATILTSIFYQPDIGVISKPDFQMVLILLGLSVALEFPVKAFAGVATAHYRFDLLSIYRIAYKIIASAVLVIMLFSGCKLKEIAVLTVSGSVITGYAFYWVSRYIYKELELSRKHMHKETVKDLFAYSSWAFLIDINLLVKQRIDLFFIGAYISLAAVSSYYISLRLLEYTVELLSKMLNIALPVLTGHEANKDDTKFREDLILFSRINAYVVVLSLTALILAGKSIIYYWMGANVDYETSYQVLIILLAGNFAALVSNGFTTALYAKSKHRLVAYIGFAETLASAGSLAIGLVIYHFGTVFVAYSIAVPLIVFRLIVLPYFSLKLMGFQHKAVIYIKSFRPLLLLVMNAATCYFMFDGTPIISWNKCVVMSVLSVLTVGFMFLEMDSRERRLLRSLAVMSGAK